MRFIHTADWHIGKVINEVSMIENQEKFLDDLIEIIKTQKVDALVIAGDLYDRSVPPKEAVQLLNKYLTKIINELNIPILSIAGNHDSNERLGFCSEILGPQGMHIEGILNQDIKCVTIKDTDFYLIPFFEPITARKVFNDENIKTYEDGFRRVIETINKKRNMNRKSVVIAHAYVINGIFDCSKSRKEIIENLEIKESDSERPLTIGGTEFIPYEVFEGFDYVALGHIHEPKRINKSDEKIRYSGSPLKYSISEKEHRNSITIVDINEEETKIKLIDIVANKEIRVLEGLLENLISDDFVKGQKIDDYIHFRLTDDGELFEPMRKIKAKYPNAISLERIRTRVLDEQILDVDYKNKNKSKIEYFEDFYCTVTGNKISKERLDIMKTVLNQIKGRE